QQITSIINRRQEMFTHVRVKTLVLGFIALALSAATALAGIIITENRPVASFSAIDIRGGFTVYLNQGETESLKLEGDKDALANIVTEVGSGRLVVKRKKGIRLFSWHKDDITVHLTFKELKKIDLSGSNKLAGQKPLVFKDLGIDISGSGEVLLDLEAAKLELSISGSGDITLKGKATSFESSISGSGDIHCFDLKANKVSISISGSGDAELNTIQELDISISGSGDVKYRGSPATVNQSVSGSGDIRKIGD
ncbi:MAG: head GIN domain-containing protein, partial [Candidatus Edwardsbacteria bacterium]|nr:head GIN domain-containing protein [Candidatus Edwardsbacteria bacterium]